MPPIDRLELLAQLRRAVEAVMTVESYSFEDKGQVKLRGRLKVTPEAAYRPMRDSMRQIGFTPFLRPAVNAEGNAVPDRYEVTAVPGVVAREKQNPQLALVLFAATVLSVVFTGALTGGQTPSLLNGLMFGASLLSILIAHEMGHYLVARWHGAQVSLPYFIPLPAPIGLGTMGAVIVQREPFEDRRTLLEVAAAGPIAGFILAVPLFILGVALTGAAHPTPTPLPAGSMSFGDSVLTTLIGTLKYGPGWTSPAVSINLHPIGFAAWIGLLITGINLMPAGQLDGGHVAYALLGERAKYVTWSVIAGLVILSFTSQTWLLWVALLFLFGRNHPSPLNEAIQLRRHHYALILAAALVFVLTFVPRPIY